MLSLRISTDRCHLTQPFSKLSVSSPVVHRHLKKVLNEVSDFLDHCMRMMPSQHYTEIKRSFFHHGLKRTALDGCVEAMKGVYSSMRLCQVCGLIVQHSICH